MSFIPSGPIPPNPSEIIVLEKVKELFQKLKENFDYIIIDTAPIGFVTDAQLISRYVDMTLYVIRQKITFKEQIKLIDSRSI